MSKILILFFCVQNLLYLSAQAQLIPHLNIISERPEFPGYLYRPNDDKSHPAIILLHGSEGGHGDFWYQPGQKPQQVGADGSIPYLARYYATLGYVTYAICYFDCKHLQNYKNYPPDELKNIDLMNVTYKAMKWLRESKFVENKPMVLWGASRGAEQAILLASLLAKLKQLDSKIVLPEGVISISPREKVAPAFTSNMAEAIISGRRSNFSMNESAWIWNGQAVPVNGMIEIQKFPNPLLVSSFQTDSVWGPTDISALQKQYAPIDVLKISDFNTNECAGFLELDYLFPRATFIEFPGTGHCFPDFGTPQSNLMNKSIERFLSQILKP